MASLLALLLAGALGCWESDNETFHRARERERRSRLAGMRSATREIERGRDLAGDELSKFLVDSTQVSVFDRAPSGQAMRYVEHCYFASDGRFVYHNTIWAREPEGREGSRWWIEGPRLCILNLDMSRDPACYAIALRPDGRPQYYIDRPGDESHGLLTKIPTAVHRGRLVMP